MSEFAKMAPQTASPTKTRAPSPAPQPKPQPPSKAKPLRGRVVGNAVVKDENDNTRTRIIIAIGADQGVDNGMFGRFVGGTGKPDFVVDETYGRTCMATLNETPDTLQLKLNQRDPKMHVEIIGY